MIEQLIEEFGEQNRSLITAAIRFLDEQEDGWGLSTPIDRRKYIAELIKKNDPL